MRSLITHRCKSSIIGAFSLLMLFFLYSTNTQKNKGINSISEQIICSNHSLDIEDEQVDLNKTAFSKTKGNINSSLNSSLSITAFLTSHLDEIKALITSTFSTEEEALVASPRTIEEIKNYKKAVIGLSLIHI